MDYYKMYQEYLNGVTCKFLAEKYGICNNTISRNFKKLGLKVDRFVKRRDKKVVQKMYDYFLLTKRLDITAKHFNMHGSSIRDSFKYFDLPVINLNKRIPNFPKLDDDFDKIVDRLLQGEKVKDIANEYGCVGETINRRLRELNITLDKRKSRCNDDFFEKIDSEIKAYLLGFFYADGSIDKNSRVSILLSEEDVYILDLFKEYVCPNSSIKPTHYKSDGINRKPQVLLRFSSKQIGVDLAKIEVLPRKTYIPGNPLKYINDELKSHFIRGFLDGDGHIRKVSYGLSFVNTSKELIKEIQKYFLRFGIESKIKENKNISAYYRLIINKKDNTKKAISLLYNNYTFALPRKEQTALEKIR